MLRIGRSFNLPFLFACYFVIVSQPLVMASPWLTIAFNTLSTVPESPTSVLATGIRNLPSSHVLHHMNRWAKYVWRPAVLPSALSTLAYSPSTENVVALGGGAVTMLVSVLDAIRRCEVVSWLPVFAVMLLSENPWTIEVGSTTTVNDMDRVISTMSFLFDNAYVLDKAVLELNGKSDDLPVERVADVTAVTSSQEEPIVELRGRVAALQMQIDDVTAIVRRNERITRDLLSSFHFWSMLLLDELRGYRAVVSENASSKRSPGDISSPPLDEMASQTSPLQPGNGSLQPGEVNIESIIGEHASSSKPPLPVPSHGIKIDATRKGQSDLTSSAQFQSSHSQRSAWSAPGQNVSSQGPSQEPVNSSKTHNREERKARRIFRDGKWVIQ